MGEFIPRETKDTGNSISSKKGYATTRRGLIAALAVLSSALATKKAHALAKPPGNTGHHCFLSGTRIRTPKGEVEVENLEIGDLVDTASGAPKPIKWIGRRRFERASGETWSVAVLPVKVARSAFGPLVPHTDLFLSPTHAVFVDGLLVPVRNLINGRTITQCTSFEADAVEYFHVELATHEVIFAAGTPAETLWAAEYRTFDNWAGDAADHPVTQPFAPRVPVFGHRADMNSKLRSAFSPWVDRRKPVDIIWERFAERAETQIGA